MVNRIYTNELHSEMEVYSSGGSVFITIKPADVDAPVPHELDKADVEVLIIDLQEQLLKIKQDL